ncbi:hypothetical protein F4780DRAFT_756786 [Xylariomycetidae sp. FL0641]|nr:hypothetical protein F4780DRAFT_756786 [Xylariomycetidae sp. FL0641]
MYHILIMYKKTFARLAQPATPCLMVMRVGSNALFRHSETLKSPVADSSPRESTPLFEHPSTSQTTIKYESNQVRCVIPAGGGCMAVWGGDGMGYGSYRWWFSPCALLPGWVIWPSVVGLKVLIGLPMYHILIMYKKTFARLAQPATPCLTGW